MSTFKDALGRDWSFSITVLEVKRLREAKQVDLLDAISHKSEQLFSALSSDPILLVDVMSILLTDQILARNLDERDFALGLVGEGLENAAEALMKELANFSGPHRGKLILAAWNKVNAANQSAASAAVQKLESLDLKAIATGAVDKAFDQALARLGV